MPALTPPACAAILLVVLLVLEAARLLAILVRSETRGQIWSGSRISRANAALLILGWFFAVKLLQFTSAQHPVLGWIGVALMLVGFGLFISTNVGRKRPAVALIRHPDYLSTFLIWTGAAASSETLLVVLSVPLVIAFAYIAWIGGLPHDYQSLPSQRRPARMRRGAPVAGTGE